MGILGMLAACTPDSVQTKSPAPTPSVSPQLSPPGQTQACPRTTGGDDSSVFLSDVRVGAHDGFDRVTFEFRPTAQGTKVPKFEIDSATPPFSEDASGKPISVDGIVFARIIFHGASGYDIERATPTYTGPKEIKPGGEVLVEVQETGDFEATLSWVFGLTRRSCWKTDELSDPMRFVVDFPH